MKRFVIGITLCLLGCENFDTLAKNAKCDGGFGCEGDTGGGTTTGGGTGTDGGPTTGGGAATGGGTAQGGGTASGGGDATGGGSTLGGGTATGGGGSDTGGGTATGGGAATGGGTAVGGGTGTGGGAGTSCPTRDGGWSLFFSSDAGTSDAGSVYPATLPWGLTTIGCNAYVLLVNHNATNHDTTELLAFDSMGTQLGAKTLGESYNDTGDQGAHRLASLDHTLVAAYPTRDGGGQLVLLDVTDGGLQEFKRASTSFMPQAVAVDSASEIAHLFGRSGTNFIYAQGTLSTPTLIIGTSSSTVCSGVNTERAVLAPDGYVVFAGVHAGTGSCTVGSYVNSTGSGVFVGEIPPESVSITAISVPGASTGEFADISVAAGDSVWSTFNTSSGASVGQISRAGSSSSFTLSLSNTTSSANFRTLPGDLAFGRDGGLELAGTVSGASSFAGVPITPDAGDYDAFILHFMNGTASDVETFGTPGTDGFTHVLVFDNQELLLGMSATYSPDDYMKAFMLSLPR